MATKSRKAAKAKAPAPTVDQMAPGDRAAWHERKARTLIAIAQDADGFNAAALAAQQATAHGLLACSARIEQSIGAQQRLPINRGDA